MTLNKPTVSVLVLNYNGKKYLDTCLSSLLKNNYPKLEAILVDNNSTDGSVEFVKRNFPSVKIIKNKKNYGYAKGYNISINKTSGDILIFLNNDTEVTENWVKRLVEAVNKNEKIGAIVAKIRLLEKRNFLFSAGGFIDYFGFAFDRGIFEEDKGQYDKPEEIFYASGAGLAVKKEIFNIVGGFDEDYFAFAEELDLCWRIRLKGYKIVYFPKALMYHKGRGSYGKKNKFVFYLTRRNTITTFLKNLEMKNTFPMLFLYMTVSFMYALTLSIRTKENFLKELIKAISDNIKNLSKTLKKREKIQKTRIIQDRDVFKYIKKPSIKEYRRLVEVMINVPAIRKNKRKTIK